MSLRFAVLVALLVSIIATARAESVVDVQVFTTSFMPVQDKGKRADAVYYLDDVERALGGLAKGLPTNIRDAEAAAQRRLNTEAGQAALQLLQASFQGLVHAWSHDVEQLPAILINDRYLLYGVPDVDEALRLFEERVP